MSTFVKLEKGTQPQISVYPNRKLNKINDNIYGGFTEHMGRCIYGGLFDPDNTNKDLIDENGFRKDVIEALKELNIPVVRYPGGNFTATYHWQDGIGPRESRPRRPELAWLGEETNQFGTDEFLRWCEVVGTEPYLCLNFGTGTLDEALAWVEYCNSDRNTYWANLRRKNGREKPYNVRYWALGNEVYGPWQIEETTKEEYAKKAYQWAKALKLFDTNLILILCGENGFSTWDSYVLKECIKPNVHALGGSTDQNLIDMHSIHIYTCSRDPVKNAMAPRCAERAIEMTSTFIDLARIQNGVSPKAPRHTICFDEWNVWDAQRAPGTEGGEEKYTLSDCLGVAMWLNVFVRQSKVVAMANIAQTVNVLSPLMTHPDGHYKQTTWWPLLLFSKYMRGFNLATHLSCPTYDGETEPQWMYGVVDQPWLDISATLSEDGRWVSMVVVNAHLTEIFSAALDGIKAASGKVQVYTVTGKAWDVTNTKDTENVKLESSEWDGVGDFKFPNMSVTMLRWQV